MYYYIKAIKNTALVAKCNGIKTLFHLLVDGPSEMAPTLTMTIVHLLDSEDTRCYIKPSVDVEVNNNYNINDNNNVIFKLIIIKFKQIR